MKLIPSYTQRTAEAAAQLIESDTARTPMESGCPGTINDCRAITM